MLVRIQLSWPCFGLVVKGGVVVQAAPIARWRMGKPWAHIAGYWLRRGASIHYAK